MCWQIFDKVSLINFLAQHCGVNEPTVVFVFSPNFGICSKNWVKKHNTTDNDLGWLFGRFFIWCLVLVSGTVFTNNLK